MAQVEFRSPLRKLVVFFQSSRDKRKEKCQQVKYEFKPLKRKFENMQKNRDLWRQRYREAKTELEQLKTRGEHLQSQNQKLQAQVEALSKKGAIVS